MALCRPHFIAFSGSKNSESVAHNHTRPMQARAGHAQAQNGASPAPRPSALAAIAPKQDRGGHAIFPAILSSRRRTTAAAVATEDAMNAQAELEEDEFPVDSPASWSRAQRALVERTVDLENLAPSPARRAEMMEQVRAGAETGLFYVKNFGVDTELLDEVRRLGKRFFDLPAEEKFKTAAAVGSRTLGYSFDFGGVNSKTGKAASQPRFREIFRQRMEPASNQVEEAWPPESMIPGFRNTMLLYSAQMNLAVQFVAGLLAEGLGLPPSYITDTYGPILFNLLIANGLPKPADAGLVGGPTHVDTNLFGFNVSDGVRGLQMFVGGEWVTTPALRDSAVFSIGDDMETISNGRYHSPYHRVLSGPRRRLSTLITCDVNPDQVIGPAEQLIDAHNPARYRVRRQGDHTDHMLESVQSLRKPDRTKSYMFLHPAQHIDQTRNVYNGEQGTLYINGEPVLL